MGSILDVCVPSRRRERRRQRQVKEKLHSRFGDSTITAPNEGGWSQPGTVGQPAKEWNTESTRHHGSPDTQRTLVDSSPELDQDFDKVITVDDSYGTPTEPREKNTITITIPLPWSSRKSHSRASSVTTQVVPLDQPKKAGSDAGQTRSAGSPPIIYKPTSDSYVQELAKFGVYESPSIGPWNFSHSTPSPPLIDTSRTHNISPVTILSPVSEDFVKGVGDLGIRSSPALTVISLSASSQRTVSPPLPAIENFSRPRHTSPELLPQPYENAHPLASNPPIRNGSATERQPAAGRGRPFQERPTTTMSTRSNVDRPGTAMSSRSITTGRSSSRGPREERIGTDRARSSSRGTGFDRTEERIGTARVRSMSRGPGLDRTSYMRSSSREPIHRRASSRDAGGPGSRATSRGPGVNVRAPSRAASVEPTHQDEPRRWNSSSSGTSSEESTIDDSVADHHTTQKASTAAAVSDISSGGGSGYRSNGKHEYTQISRGTDLFSESESEADESSNSAVTARGTKFERLKEKVKSPFIGGPELVPDGDELWS